KSKGQRARSRAWNDSRVALFVFEAARDFEYGAALAPDFSTGSLHFALCTLPFAARGSSAFSRTRGTASAEGEDGKHANKRAPAAITSLSAASRCASRPPSDPSDKSPRTWNPVRNDRVLPRLNEPFFTV